MSNISYLMMLSFVQWLLVIVVMRSFFFFIDLALAQEPFLQLLKENKVMVALTLITGGLSIYGIFRIGAIITGGPFL